MSCDGAGDGGRRVLVINPNRSVPCGDGIAAAIAPVAAGSRLRFDVVSLPDGPEAVLSWADWHAAVAPVLSCITREAAAGYVIACASDPGIEAARAVAAAPVWGIFRAAVGAAVARAERFGVVAIVEASRARHLAALRAMGLEARLAAEVALDVSMAELLDPTAVRTRLIAAARDCVAAGAGVVILGCTGMAHHRAAVAAAVGVPVIEPCQAAAGLALAALAG